MSSLWARRQTNFREAKRILCTTELFSERVLTGEWILTKLKKTKNQNQNKNIHFVGNKLYLK